jgi:hypothetical protein
MSVSLSSFINDNSGIKHLDDLPTDAQVLISFLILIVDIQYRNKYGKVFEEQHGKGYSVTTIEKVLADQLPPVDDGLLGH